MATVKRPRTRKTAETKEQETPPSKPAGNVAAISTRSLDLQEAIRQRAYELYQQRGREHGADLQDWTRAEKEVLERFRGRTA
jgi:Protein of unknown function (DUF2934)